MSGSHFASRFRPQPYDGQSIDHCTKDGKGSVSDWRLRLTASDNTGGRHVPLMHAPERGATQTSEDTHGDEVDDEEASADIQNKRQRRFLYASSSRAQTPRHGRPNNNNTTHSNECSFIGRFTTTPIVAPVPSSSPSPSTARLLHTQEDEEEQQPGVHSRFAPRPWRSTLDTHAYPRQDTSVNHSLAWTRPVTSTPQPQQRQHSYNNAHTRSTVVAVGPSSSIQGSSSLLAAATMGTTTTSAPASSSGFTPRFRYGGAGQRARTLYNLHDRKDEEEREEYVTSKKRLGEGGRWQLPSVLTTHRVEPLVESAPPWRLHQRPFSSVGVTSESTATFAPRPAWGSTTAGAVTTPRFVPHSSSPEENAKEKGAAARQHDLHGVANTTSAMMRDANKETRWHVRRPTDSETSLMASEAEEKSSAPVQSRLGVHNAEGSPTARSPHVEGQQEEEEVVTVNAEPRREDNRDKWRELQHILRENSLLVHGDHSPAFIVELDLSGVRFSESEWTLLVEDILSQLSATEVLRLARCELDDRRVIRLLQQGMTRPHTTRYNSSTNSDSDDRRQWLPVLRVLDLRANALTYRCLTHLGRWLLWAADTMDHLQLSQNALRDYGFQILAIYLTKLTLSHVESEPALFCPGLVQRVRTRHERSPSAQADDMHIGLAVLELERCGASPRGLSELMAGASRAQRLHTLYIGQNSPTISSESTAAVKKSASDTSREALSANTSITTLFANFGPLHCPAALRHIALDNVPLSQSCTAAGCRELLLNLFFCCPELTQLGLSAVFDRSLMTEDELKALLHEGSRMLRMHKGSRNTSPARETNGDHHHQRVYESWQQMQETMQTFTYGPAHALLAGQVRVGDLFAELIAHAALNAVRRARPVPPAFAQLRVLSLNDAGLSDFGACMLCSALTSGRALYGVLSGLQEVQLRNNLLSAQGCVMLIRSLFSLDNYTNSKEVNGCTMKELWLEGNAGVKSDDMRALEAIAVAAQEALVQRLHHLLEPQHMHGKTSTNVARSDAAATPVQSPSLAAIGLPSCVPMCIRYGGVAPAPAYLTGCTEDGNTMHSFPHVHTESGDALAEQLRLYLRNAQTATAAETTRLSTHASPSPQRNSHARVTHDEEDRITQGSPTPGTSPAHEEHVPLPASHDVSPTPVARPTKASKETVEVAEHTVVVEGNNNVKPNAHSVRSSCDTDEPVVVAVHSKLAIGEGNDSGDRGTHEASSSSPFTLTRVTGNKAQHGTFHHVHSNSTSTNMDDTHRESMQDLPSALEPHPVAPMAALTHEHHTDDDADEDEDETIEDKSNAAAAAAAVHITPSHSLPYGPHKEGRMRTILYPYLPTEGHLLHHAMPILCLMEEDGQQARKALEEDLRDLVSGSSPEQNHKDSNPGNSGSKAVDSVGRVTCHTFYDRALQSDLLLITLVTTERRSVLKERLQSSLMAESSASPVQQQQRYFPHLVNYLRQLALSAPQESKPSSASEKQSSTIAEEEKEEEATREEQNGEVQAGRSLSDPPQPDQPTAVKPKTTIQAAHMAESVEKAAVEPGNTHNGDIHEKEEAVTAGEGLLAEQDTFEAALRAKAHTLPRHATPTPSVGRTKTFVFSFTHRPGTTLCRAWTVLHEASEIGELARGCAEADFTALLQPGPNSERNNNNNISNTVLEVSVVAGDVSLNTLQLRVRTNERRATIESRLQRIHSTTTNNSNSGVEGGGSQGTSFSPTSLMAAVALPSDGFASLAQLLSESPQYDCLVVLRRYLANTPRRGHTAHYLQQTYRSLDLFLHYCHATPSPLLSRELGFTSLGQLMEDVNALTAKRAADTIEGEHDAHVVPEVSEDERDRRETFQYAREGQPTRLGYSMQQSISESNSNHVVQADHYSSSQAPLPNAHQTHPQPSYSTPLEADSYSDSKVTRSNNNDAASTHILDNSSTLHEARAQPAQNASSTAEEAVLDDDLADGFYPSSSARGDDIHGAHVSSYQQSHEQETSKAAESIQHEDDNNNYNNNSSSVVALDPPLVPRRTASAHTVRGEGSEPAMASAELPIERNGAEAMDSIVSATTTATATATAAMPLVSPSTAASSYVSVRSNARHFGPAMCDLSPLTPQEEEGQHNNNNNNDEEEVTDKDGNNKRLVKGRASAEAQSAQWATGDSQGLHASSLSPSPPHSVEVSHSRHNDDIPLLDNNNEDIRSPQMTEERPRAAGNTSAQQPIFVTESLEFEGSDTPRQRNANIRQQQQQEVVRVSRRENNNEEAAAVVVVTERPRMAHDSGSATATAAAAAPPALTTAAHTTDYRHRRVTSGATVSCSSQADAMDNTSTQTPHRSRRGHPSRGVTERTREKVHRHLMQLAFDGMAKGSIALNPKEQQTIRVGKGKWGTQPVLITLEWDVMFALTFEKPSRPFMSKKRACMLVHPLAFGFDCMPESTNHKSELRHNLLIHIRRPYSPETFGIAPSDIESALMHGATLTAPTRTAWPGSAIPNASVTDASSEVSRTSTINTGAGMLVARLLQDNIVLAVTMKSSKQVREAVMILQDGVQRAQKAVNEAVKMAKVARNSARYNSGT